jgi:hypothetical protein
MGIDQVFVIEMMDRISNSMSKFIGKASGHCTASEMLYYETLILLATLIPLCVSMDKSAPVPEILDQITEAVKASMTTQLEDLPTLDSTVANTVSTLRCFHSITMLRDTAMGTKLAAQWILSFNEREKERDRSGKSNLRKEVLSQVKGLQTASEAALKEGKALIAKLKSEVGVGSEFGARLRNWALDDGDKELCDLVEDGTVKEVVESWRQNIAGWGQVKWE